MKRDGLSAQTLNVFLCRFCAASSVSNTRYRCCLYSKCSDATAESFEVHFIWHWEL
jgi:hypothetical protein